MQTPFKHFRLAFLMALFLQALSANATGDSAPQSPDDPFLWLEEVEGPRALEWVRAQNERALDVLTSDSRYERYYEAALAIAQDKSRIPTGALRDGWVYNFWQDETHVRGVWRRTTLESYETSDPQWQTVLDVDALAAAEGKNWVWKGASCLPGSSRCLVKLSDGGKDASVVREYDVEDRRFVPQGFILPEAKSNVVWQDADTLLVSTDWGENSLTSSGYPFVVKQWRRGTPLSQATLVHSGTAQDVAVAPFRLDGPQGEVLLGIAEANTFFTSTYYILSGARGGEATHSAPTTTLVRLPLPPKSTVRALQGDQIVFTLEQDWQLGRRKWMSGSLLSLSVADVEAAAPRVRLIFAPGPRESIDDVALTRAGLLIASYKEVRGRLFRASYKGGRWTKTRLPIPDTGTVGIVTADERADVAFVTYQDFLQPTTLYRVAVNTGEVAPVKSLPAKFDASRFTTEQFHAVSKDGTRVPYFVVRPRDMVADGKNPTLLYAYGGFQVSMLPSYSGTLGQLWLEQGGVYVLANIRGGGEFGPAWHQAGLKTNRQVVYDDFIAVAEDLIRRQITSPEHLGIQGGSNGGLLMGVMLTQRPDLFNAVVVQVPLLDMLRYHQLLAGASWVDEYGSPDVPEERAWLERLSPYHNLEKRERFPVPFLLTSTKDDRVHPGHARKYAAKLEALGMPFLYYENMDGGHSAAANLRERAKRQALEFTYLAQRLFPTPRITKGFAQAQ
jgi:prolyl oligopeptidase